jgi:sulfite reductase (ferredoxin)
MVTSAPDEGRDLERIEAMARNLAARFQPQSQAYWELWVDGDRTVSAQPHTQSQVQPHGQTPSVGELAAESEPIYGPAYLPRKFKVGLAFAGDNSIDVYSHDVGLVLHQNGRGESGAVVLAGGGLGRSHKDPTTFPRLGEPLAWVPDELVPDVLEAIVTTFRDEGNRHDRSHARLKYLVEERGIGWLRGEVEERLGRTLDDPVALPAWGGTRDHLGWHRQGDGRWYLGLPVPSGRLTDTEHIERRRAVRRVVEEAATEVRLTPNQDILLCGIAEADKGRVEAILDEHRVPRAEHLSLSVLSSMACPALPTCGQALGEAERVLPELAELLDNLLTERGLGDVRIETRMTGCPNGCARPYVAELGIVGRTKTAYDIFVGGDPAGTRLAVPLIESVPFRKLSDVVGPLLDRFGQSRLQDEAFGDWANRLGTPALSEGLPRFERAGRRSDSEDGPAAPTSLGSDGEALVTINLPAHDGQASTATPEPAAPEPAAGRNR